MARKSRKQNVAVVTPVETSSTSKKCYKAALYGRLSYVRHGKEAESEETIENQMDLLRAFVEQQEDIVLGNEYTDLDCSGTDFERDGFDQMMSDIKAGSIDCVIVKDLSRLGRNYIETGTLIERVFPFLGVRFISVTDDFDSDKNEVDLSIPLKNIVNEFYAKDISHKVLTSLDAKFKRGECAVSRLPYGYKKDPQDSHKMIIDEAVADNVKLMFKMTLENVKTSDIKNRLNELGIMTPAAYKDFVRLGFIREKTNTIWNETGVKKILRNYNYTGDTAHGVKSGSKYTHDRYKNRPMEEWLIVEDTHEAIISKGDYFAVQKILEQRQKKYAKDTADWIHIQHKNKYGDKIVCGHCEKKALMTGRRDRRRDSFKIMYMCQNLKNCRTGAEQYKGHFMYDVNVDSTVYAVIRDHIKGCLDAETVIKMTNQGANMIRQHDVFARNVMRTRAEMQTVKDLKADLFADYSHELITAEQYVMFTEQYNAKLEQLKFRLEENLKMHAQYSKNFEIDKDWKSVVEKYKSKRSLSKEMIDAFVSKIVIWDKKTIEVHLKYDDLFNELIALSKERECE